eukprot:1159097-Pelagomonas_calceolata.AAC.15
MATAGRQVIRVRCPCGTVPAHTAAATCEWRTWFGGAMCILCANGLMVPGTPYVLCKGANGSMVPGRPMKCSRASVPSVQRYSSPQLNPPQLYTFQRQSSPQLCTPQSHLSYAEFKAPFALLQTSNAAGSVASIQSHAHLKPCTHGTLQPRCCLKVSQTQNSVDFAMHDMLTCAFWFNNSTDVCPWCIDSTDTCPTTNRGNYAGIGNSPLISDKPTNNMQDLFKSTRSEEFS